MIPQCPAILLRIAQELESQFSSTSIRGEGAATFVYVRLDKRAVEISMLDDRHVWIEFWDLSAADDAPPAKDDALDSVNETLDRVRTWLTSSRGAAGTS